MTNLPYAFLRTLLVLFCLLAPLTAEAACDYVDQNKRYPISSARNADIFENVKHVYVASHSTMSLQNRNKVYKPENISEIMMCSLQARKRGHTDEVQYSILKNDPKIPFFSRVEVTTPGSLIFWVNVKENSTLDLAGDKLRIYSVTVSHIRADMPAVQNALEFCSQPYVQHDGEANDEQLLTQAIQRCAHAKINERFPK